MNSHDLIQSFNYIGEDLVNEAEYGQFPARHEQSQPKSHKTFRCPLLVAALVALLLLLVGPVVVPTVNIKSHLDTDNINLITCGGQATIPIIHAINQVQDVEYAEIVATISSKSAGPGTRANIDEFTQTTARGIREVGGAKNGKAIIILNPAEPPILMRDTIHCIVQGIVNEREITQSIESRVEEVRMYVPGYRLRQKPIFDGNKITVFIEVEGAGDYLPKYSGNLDIMTAASVKVAEEWAKHKILKN